MTAVKWLTTSDINQALADIPGFIGAHGIDYIQGTGAMGSLMDPAEDRSIVLNTHPAHMPGEHWFAMYVSPARKSICVFDSMGDHPPMAVRDLVARMLKEYPGYKFYANRRRVQWMDGPCGYYAIDFIRTLSKTQQPCTGYFGCKELDDKYVLRRYKFSKR
jgi:hypothetical protein